MITIWLIYLSCYKSYLDDISAILYVNSWLNANENKGVINNPGTKVINENFKNLLNLEDFLIYENLKYHKALEAKVVNK